MDEGLEAWVGRTQTARDVIDPFAMSALAATLDRTDHAAMRPGAVVPPLWTWASFLTAARMSDVGPDGHPKRGGFLPPVPLPRRMWAGSRVRFDAPLKIGDAIEKRSTILKVAEKTGKAGTMVFVTVGHETFVDDRPAIREEQDIVYLAIPDRFQLPAPIPVPECEWKDTIAFDPVLLFRFSALTFNCHRIHYDRTYAETVEKYPGLVVHGPLQAIALYEAGARWSRGRPAARFDFKGVRPLFDFEPATVHGLPNGRGLDLYMATGSGHVTMQASYIWAD
jgi:3-methylfumaryl-CoA hydratase